MAGRPLPTPFVWLVNCRLPKVVNLRRFKSVVQPTGTSRNLNARISVKLQVVCDRAPYIA